MIISLFWNTSMRFPTNLYRNCLKIHWICVFKDAIKSGYLEFKSFANSDFTLKSQLEYHLLNIFSWHSKTLGPSLFSLFKLISPNWLIKFSKDTSVIVWSSLDLSTSVFPNWSLFRWPVWKPRKCAGDFSPGLSCGHYSRTQNHSQMK